MPSASCTSVPKGRRGEKARNEAGIDPDESSGHGRLNHRPLIDPRQPRLVDHARADWDDPR